MLNLNCTILAAVVSKALESAAANQRWVNAIRRAADELDSNPWIERNQHGGLIIGSPSSKLYSANGVCSCEAYTFGRPCWHRAASRLVRLHDEREASATQLADHVINVVDQSRRASRAAAAFATDALNELYA